MVVLVGLLIGPALAPAEPIGVKDGAGLFKPETVRKAVEQIERIQRLHHTDVYIETVASLSGEQLGEFKKLKDATARERFGAELAEQRARDLGASGIYVWMCKSPPRVEVVVGPAVSEEVFPAKNRKELRESLTRRFGQHTDRDLLRAVERVGSSLEAARRPVVWPWALGIVLGVLAVWVVVGLMVRGRDPAGGAVEQASSHRVTGGLLGGMFGAAGSLWIYHSMFGKPGGSAVPADSDAAFSPPESDSPGENPDGAGSVEEGGNFADHPEAFDSHARSDGGTIE